MKRIIVLAVAVLLAVTSCSSTWPTAKPVTGWASAYDNAAESCAVDAVMLLVPDGHFVTVRCEWWQSGVLLSADSLVVARGGEFSFAPPALSDATELTAALYARDEGGTSCPAFARQVPTVRLIPPAKVVLP